MAANSNSRSASRLTQLEWVRSCTEPIQGARLTFAGYVRHQKDRLSGQEPCGLHPPAVVGIRFGRSQRCAELEHRSVLLESASFRCVILRVCAPLLVFFCHRPLENLEIGKHELGFNDLGVTDRINIRKDMGHVWRVKAADDVCDGVNLTDFTEKLVAEALAAAGAFHQSGDVDEANRTGGCFLRLKDRLQGLQPRVGDGHDAHVAFDGRERVVRHLGMPRGEGIEESRLTDIWQPDDSH